MLFSAQDRKNYKGFYDALEEAVNKKTVLNSSALEEKYEKIEAYKNVKALVPENVIPGYSSVWLATKAIEGDAPVTAKIKAAIAADKKSAFEGYLNTCEKGVLKTGEAKFAWIDGLLEGSVTSKSNTRKLGKFDRMITHRIWGKPVVVLTVLLGLIGSFIPALPFMGCSCLGYSLWCCLVCSSNAFDSMVWCRSSSGNCCNSCCYDSSYVDYFKGFWTLSCKKRRPLLYDYGTSSLP